AEAEGEAEDAEGAAAFLIAKEAVNGRQHLRGHQCCPRTLQHARGDPLAARMRQAAPRPGPREFPEAGQKNEARATEVAQAPAGDDERGECDLIEHDYALNLAGGRVEVGADRGDRHIDDESVDHEDELSRNNDGEHPPASVTLFCFGKSCGNWYWHGHRAVLLLTVARRRRLPAQAGTGARGSTNW